MRVGFSPETIYEQCDNSVPYKYYDEAISCSNPPTLKKHTHDIRVRDRPVAHKTYPKLSCHLPFSFFLNDWTLHAPILPFHVYPTHTAGSNIHSLSTLFCHVSRQRLFIP